MSNLHAVFATDGDNNNFRVSDPTNWNAAQFEWNRLEDLRQCGRLPQVKFFSVRSVTLGPDRELVGPTITCDDPKFRDAPLSVMFARPVLKGSQGFEDDVNFTGRRTLVRSGAEKAARKAWKLFAPQAANRGAQGDGGWFFWPNGRPAAQGLRDLARVCTSKCLIVKGTDGKWFVIDNNEEAS